MLLTALDGNPHRVALGEVRCCVYGVSPHVDIHVFTCVSLAQADTFLHVYRWASTMFDVPERSFSLVCGDRHVAFTDTPFALGLKSGCSLRMLWLWLLCGLRLHV